MMNFNLKIFGCTCPACANENMISLEQFLFEKAINCKNCGNIYCNWQGSKGKVNIYPAVVTPKRDFNIN